MTTYFEKNKFIAAGLLSFIVFISLVFPVTTCYFGHIHVLPNGEVICHSHIMPYSGNKQDETNHSHSNKELLFLQFVNSIVKFVLTVIPLVLFYALEAFFFRSPKIIITKSNRFSFFSLRAPPAYII
jgi:hypothetical protein